MKDLKEFTRNVFSETPREKEIKDVIEALNVKREKDKYSDCDINFVENVIKTLGEKNNETVLDTMITSAMLLPTYMLLFAVDKLKDLISFKMLKDIKSMAGSDYDIDTKRIEDSDLLKNLEKLIKDMNKK